MKQQEADKIYEWLCKYVANKPSHLLTETLIDIGVYLNSLVSEDEPLTINLDGRVCPLGTVSPEHKLHIKTKLETDTEIAKRAWMEYDDWLFSYDSTKLSLGHGVRGE